MANLSITAHKAVRKAGRTAPPRKIPSPRYRIYNYLNAMVSAFRPFAISEMAADTGLSKKDFLRTVEANTDDDIEFTPTQMWEIYQFLKGAFPNLEFHKLYTGQPPLSHLLEYLSCESGGQP